MTAVYRTSCALLALTAAAAGPAAGQQRIDRGMGVASRASIRVHNLVGSVRVVGWDRDSLAVTGTVAPGGGRFDMGGGGSGAKLFVEIPRGTERPPPAHLEIRVPSHARVWVKSASASIEVIGVVRALDLNSVGGTIIVRSSAAEPEELRVESMDGEIRIETGGGWTRVKSAGGAVTMHGGRDVAIENVSGTVSYTGDTFRRLRIETVSGDIWFDGDMIPGAQAEFESHAGRVELALPERVSAEFTLTNFNGRIENAFAAGSPRPLPDLRGETVEFVTRRGEATVTVRNFRGEIVLRRR